MPPKEKKPKPPPNIKKLMKKARVIPDVTKKPPKIPARVLYESAVEINLSNAGESFPPCRVKSQPMIEWNGLSTDLHTIILVDPDAPNAEEHTEREWLHWLVVNVPGEEICKGDVIADYVGSAPPADTGKHRYVLLIYKQFKGKPLVLQDEPIRTNTSIENRPGFNTMAFVTKYKLKKPIAGNFYLAEFDDYVPQLYKQLGVDEKKPFLQALPGKGDPKAAAKVDPKAPAKVEPPKKK